MEVPKAVSRRRWSDEKDRVEVPRPWGLPRPRVLPAPQEYERLDFFALSPREQTRAPRPKVLPSAAEVLGKGVGRESLDPQGDERENPGYWDGWSPVIRRECRDERETRAWKLRKPARACKKTRV